MRRLGAAAIVAVVVAIAVYWFAIRDKTVAPTVEVPRLAAQIGAGDEAILVAADGEVIRWGYRPHKLHLPQLPLGEAPKRGRLRGPGLEQAEVLGAVPPPLRRFLVASRYGESGVDVELSSGIEVRFGSSSQAERKWKAAAAILADPSVTTLSYVNVQAPSKASVGGEGHTLPE